MVKLNLGSRDRRFPGFLSVDIAPPADVVADLSRPWPWNDSSVEEVRAYHIFEHIADSIHVMNELWRVCRRGAVIDIEVPSATHGAGAWQDPTHKSFWTMNSFQYFEDGSAAHKRFSDAYGIAARFKIRSITETQRQDVYEPIWKIRAVLECVK
jgi:predicted SAM-dependent methyltransferase